MKYQVRPQTRLRKTGPTYSVAIVCGGKMTRLSGFPSHEAAKEEAQRIKPLLNDGTLTIEELIANRQRLHKGLTQLEWAEKLGVHRNTIYQGAKYQGITWQEWIDKKLPELTLLSER